nr:reverse transcriptase domain-containing protein [Tanacetum cinerariifolium]
MARTVLLNCNDFCWAFGLDIKLSSVPAFQYSSQSRVRFYLSERLSNESFGTSETRDRARFLGQSQRSLSRSRALSHLRLSKRLKNISISKAKSRKGRTKTRGKWSEPREESLDIDYREDSKDTCDDLSTPYKRPKPTPFITRITHFKYQEKVKLPRKVKVYEGSKDPEDHLDIFSTTAEREGWLMPVWCKMFRQTLSGATRNWGMKVINMVGSGGCHNRLYEMEGPGLTKEIDFSAIPKNSLTCAPIILEGMIKGYYLRRIYVDGGSSLEIIYEHCFKSFDADIKSRLKKSIVPLIRFSGKIYHPLGLVDLRVTMGEPGRNKTMLQEFHSEVWLSLQCDYGKNKNEKPQSGGFNHPFDYQVPNG